MASVGFWDDEQYDINSMYSYDIPWVATRSMTFALEDMHFQRSLNNGNMHHRYSIDCDGHFAIYDWMKKVEMQRSAPVWGYNFTVRMIFLLHRELYGKNACPEFVECSHTKKDWDTEVHFIEQNDPYCPEALAFLMDEEREQYVHEEHEADKTDAMYNEEYRFVQKKKKKKSNGGLTRWIMTALSFSQNKKKTIDDLAVLSACM